MADIVFFDRQAVDVDEYQTPAEKCVRGRPTQRVWNYHTSSDGKFFSGLWEGDPGCWRVNYTENEFCRILSGRSILRSASGEEFEVGPGDSFVIPAGFEGQWDVIETTKKIYAIYEP
ncbi:MAG TPA: cupin domain-containing protein [Woeseiaceae bacterium]|nr:cupin domain-containing protein [Woeseiaceae bacterium]